MQTEKIRGWQYERMTLSVRTIESIIQSTSPEALTTYRDGGNGWTVLQVLCHLRDFEAVFFERARLTVEQDSPPLPFPNPDELASSNDYENQVLEDVLAAWKETRHAYMDFLQSRSESDWERTAVHPKRGMLTLLEQTFITPLHDSIHIEQMTRILAEKLS